MHHINIHKNNIYTYLVYTNLDNLYLVDEPILTKALTNKFLLWF